MALTGKQSRHLRALGHHLEPVVHVGKEGVTEALSKAIDQALTDHELIKLKLNPETPEDRAALATAIYEALVENGEIEHSLKACVTEDFCVLYGYGAHLDALVSNVVEVATRVRTLMQDAPDWSLVERYLRAIGAE